MVRTLTALTRTAVLSGLCLVGAFSSATAQAADAGAADVAEQKVAIVRLRIRVGDKVVRAPVRAVRWGETATFTLKVGGQVHEVNIRPDAADGGATVRFSYARDGESLAADASHNVKLRHATSVFADDASAVAITIIPTRATIGHG